MTSDVMNVCRLCLRDTAIINIFETATVPPKIVEIVKDVAGVQILRSDIVSTSLCEKCIRIMSEMHILRKVYLKNDSILKERVKNQLGIKIHSYGESIVQNYPNLKLPPSVWEWDRKLQINLDQKEISRWESCKNKETESSSNCLEDKIYCISNFSVEDEECIEADGKRKTSISNDMPLKKLKIVFHEENALFDVQYVENPMYECTICNDNLPSSDTLKAHIRNHKICNFCQLEFETIEETKRHSEVLCPMNHMNSTNCLVELKRCDEIESVSPKYRGALRRYEESMKRMNNTSDEIITPKVLSKRSTKKKPNVVEEKVAIVGENALDVNYDESDVMLLKNLLQRVSRPDNEGCTQTNIPRNSDISASYKGNKLFELHDACLHLDYSKIPLNLTCGRKFSAKYSVDGAPDDVHDNNFIHQWKKKSTSLFKNDPKKKSSLDEQNEVKQSKLPVQTNTEKFIPSATPIVKFHISTPIPIGQKHFAPTTIPHGEQNNLLKRRQDVLAKSRVQDSVIHAGNNNIFRSFATTSTPLSTPETKKPVNTKVPCPNVTVPVANVTAGYQNLFFYNNVSTAVNQNSDSRANNLMYQTAQRNGAFNFSVGPPLQQFNSVNRTALLSSNVHNVHPVEASNQSKLLPAAVPETYIPPKILYSQLITPAVITKSQPTITHNKPAHVPANLPSVIQYTTLITKESSGCSTTYSPQVIAQTGAMNGSTNRYLPTASNGVPNPQKMLTTSIHSPHTTFINNSNGTPGPIPNTPSPIGERKQQKEVSSTPVQSMTHYGIRIRKLEEMT